MPAAKSLQEMFPAVLADAEASARACPIEMGGPADLELLYHLAKHLKAERVIETGVAYGWSSLALLLALKDQPRGMLISTDRPYIGRYNDAHVGCVVPASLRSRWHLIRRADQEGVPKALRQLESIDLCHYDSDKSYQGRKWAYPRLWEALRQCGCFISDDIGDNTAFQEHCDQLGLEPVIVAAPAPRGVKYSGIVLKQ